MQPFEAHALPLSADSSLSDPVLKSKLSPFLAVNVMAVSVVRFNFPAKKPSNETFLLSLCQIN